MWTRAPTLGGLDTPPRPAPPRHAHSVPHPVPLGEVQDFAQGNSRADLPGEQRLRSGMPQQPFLTSSEEEGEKRNCAVCCAKLLRSCPTLCHPMDL